MINEEEQEQNYMPIRIEQIYGTFVGVLCNLKNSTYIATNNKVTWKIGCRQ